MFYKLITRFHHGWHIEKQDTNYRIALPVGLKLAITLRYQATGDTYKTLMYGISVPDNTICDFIPKVCESIIKEFSDEVITCSTTAAEWCQ